MEKEWFEEETRRMREAAPPPPPTQSEEETARLIAEHAGINMLDDYDLFIAEMSAALRQRANEATRACEAIMQETLAKIRSYADDHDDEMVPILIDEALAAIRARIAP